MFIWNVAYRGVSVNVILCVISVVGIVLDVSCEYFGPGTFLGYTRRHTREFCVSLNWFSRCFLCKTVHGHPTTRRYIWVTRAPPQHDNIYRKGGQWSKIIIGTCVRFFFLSICPAGFCWFWSLYMTNFRISWFLLGCCVPKLTFFGSCEAMRHFLGAYFCRLFNRIILRIW